MNVIGPEGRIVEWTVWGVAGSGLADVKYSRCTCAVVRSQARKTLKYQTDIHAGSLCEGLRVRTRTCSLTWRGSSRKIRYSPHEEWDLVAGSV